MPTRPEYDGLLPEGDPTDLASLLRLNVERPNVRTPRPPVIAGGDPALDALAAAMLGDEEPSPRALVNALRGRESLGELGMAGGDWVRSAAAPVLQGARQRLAPTRGGESQATSLLKRTMAAESLAKRAPLDAEDMAFVETLPPQMRGLIRTKGDAAEARRGVMTGQIKAMAPTEAQGMELDRERLALDRARLAEERRRRAADTERGAREGGLKSADDLRKEFNATQTAKDANAIIGAYDKIEAAPPNGQGDLALITMYMRLLDPSTGVKEGEFQNAAKSAGSLEQLRVMYDKVSKGELLSPETRERFKVAGRTLRDAALRSYDKAGVPYRKLATQRGVNPDEVVFPLGSPAPAAGAAPAASTMTPRERAAAALEAARNARR